MLTTSHLLLSQSAVEEYSNSPKQEAKDEDISMSEEED